MKFSAVVILALCAVTFATKPEKQSVVESFLQTEDGECAKRCTSALLGDGECDYYCENAACEWDKGDCPVHCTDYCYEHYLGDGYCDEVCNVESCNYDKGDC